VLLQRTTRKLSLTDAGLAFVEEAEVAIARLEAAQEAVTELQRDPRGRLRVTTAVTIGELFLAPVLAEFLEAFPAVEVLLRLTDRPVVLVAERFDVPIRAGHLPDSSLIARRIGCSTYRVVASPAYLARHGTPQRPAELSSHACLRFSRSGMELRDRWPFGAGARRRDVPVSGRLVSDDVVVLRTAAEQGLGIARLPGLLVHEAISAPPGGRTAAGTHPRLHRLCAAADDPGSGHGWFGAAPSRRWGDGHWAVGCFLQGSHRPGRRCHSWRPWRWWFRWSRCRRLMMDLRLR
jgi:DNA-binding transcriptional LysR family regulator